MSTSPPKQRPVFLAIVFLTALVGFFAVRSTLSQDGAIHFTPPDARTRFAAIGSVKNLSPVLRQAFDSNDSFDPIPVPGGSDWLAQHAEVGQSFAQYLRSKPNQPTAGRNTLYFQPIGEFGDAEAPDLQRLSDFASAFFSLPVKINDPVELKGLPIQSRQRQSGRTQLLSTDILNWLKTRVPDDGYCLLAITMEDLYPDPSWNFVFGQASLRDRVGVYSFARYHPAFSGRTQVSNDEIEKLVLLRSCKVLAHETGHMFGIKHCVHFHCLMNGSNHLGETDSQPIHLCPVCLRKLQVASQCDVVKRYQALKVFSDQAGWKSESQWLKSRLLHLK